MANVAFRLDEPVREWFEQDQALALFDGPLALRLDAHWRGHRDVTAVAEDGRTWTARLGPEDGELVLTLEAGSWQLTIERNQGPLGGK